MTSNKATRAIAGTRADATLPKTPVTVGGKTYDLCFDLGALSEAETAINAELAAAGRRDFVNLLYALPAGNLSSTRLIFAAAVRTFHPELTFDEATRLLELPDLFEVAVAVKAAWAAAVPEAEEQKNPQPAGE
ncbi:MAG TPA: hypothetical protein VKB47_08800 [Terracidiphilus sp.]|nr:hypothetical protein [Terracidiphilus sp.]